MVTEQQPFDVVIIGGGPAGASAALYTARARLRTLVLDKSLTAGALGMTSKIANYPGVPEVLTGAALLERMRAQAEAHGAEFRKARVVATELRTDPKHVVTATGEEYSARALILATGAMGRATTIPGEQEYLGRGVSYCATCDAPFYQGARVLVVGSSDEAVEEAIVLTRFAARVFLAAPKENLDADPALVQQFVASGKGEILPRARVRRIEGNGTVTGVVLQRPGGEQPLEVSGVFVYTQGSKPITDFLLGQVETTETGAVVVSPEMATNVPGVYAAGDLLSTGVEQAVVAAANGVIAALGVDKYLRGRARLAKDYQ
ncbi:MAG: FAD-dependent oxidoreductase [Armatimonadetes bacterium]|nr:FAD-dependent oxidoreductase [Armatimonadota bacterium]